MGTAARVVDRRSQRLLLAAQQRGDRLDRRVALERAHQLVDRDEVELRADDQQPWLVVGGVVVLPATAERHDVDHATVVRRREAQRLDAEVGPNRRAGAGDERLHRGGHLAICNRELLRLSGGD